MTTPPNASPLPLCMFTNSEVRGGAEQHMLDLLLRLDCRRFRLALACPAPLIERLRADLPAEVETFVVSIARPADWRAMLAFAGFLRHKKIQIVHSHLFYSSLFASPIANWAGVPVVVETPHLRESWRRGWKASYVIDRLAGRYVHVYIAVSHANRRYLIEEKGLPPEKVTAIQNGSEVEKFDPRHRPPSGLRTQLGFGESDPILLLPGRLEPQKGHAVLLQALPTVLAAVANVRLVCVGDGTLRAALEAQVRELGLAACVRLVGYQANMQDWLALADICVLPSLFEGLPLAAIESLAAGRPMVASAVDGTPEIIVDGETGLTVPPGDPKALSAAIVRLLQDPELRARLSQAGRRRVEQYFDIRRQVSETERLYQRTWEKSTGQLLSRPDLGMFAVANADPRPLAGRGGR
jgi:glycosyltransferase involved in cell wall biosynthesis